MHEGPQYCTCDLFSKIIQARMTRVRGIVYAAVCFAMQVTEPCSFMVYGNMECLTLIDPGVKKVKTPSLFTVKWKEIEVSGIQRINVLPDLLTLWVTHASHS